MDISKVSKPKLLAALYNRAQPLGLGFLQYNPAEMDENEAAELLKNQTYFDYLKGRVMKVDFSKDEMRTDLYNRDNGPNAAEDVLAMIS